MRGSRRRSSGGEGPGGGGHGKGERHRGARGPCSPGPPSLRQSTHCGLWGQHPLQQWTSLGWGCCGRWRLAGAVRLCGITPTPNVLPAQRRRPPTGHCYIGEGIQGRARAEVELGIRPVFCRVCPVEEPRHYLRQGYSMQGGE
jgi:hypothetical protein